MPAKIIIYFLALGLLWLVVFRVYGLWVDRSGGYQWKSVVGIGLAYCCLLSWVMPGLGSPWLCGRGQDPGPPSQSGIWFLLFAGIVGLAGVICFGSRIKSHRTLGACSTESERLTPPGTLKSFRLARENLARLQRILEERTGRMVPLCLTESLHLPLLVGPNPHRVYVPILFAMQGSGVEPILEPLARWSGFRRYRGYMFLWWISQFCLLLQPLTSGIRRALERELAQEAGGDPARGQDYQAALAAMGLPAVSGIPMGLVPLCIDRHPPRPCHRWPWGFLPVFGLLCLCGWGARVSGGFDGRDLLRVLGRGELVGYSLHAYDPAVSFMPKAGEGGLLPDGVIVDTRGDTGRAGCCSVRLPLGLIASETLVPFDAEALNIHLEWKTHAMTPAASDPPAMKIECSEQTGIDGRGQQKLRAFYTRAVLMPKAASGRGALDIPIRLHPAVRIFKDSTDVIYGPVIYVPKGWRIELGHYAVQKIPVDKVPRAPDGEVARFVAWYQMHGGRSALPDLRWGAGHGPHASAQHGAPP